VRDRNDGPRTDPDARANGHTTATEAGIAARARNGQASRRDDRAGGFRMSGNISRVRLFTRSRQPVTLPVHSRLARKTEAAATTPVALNAVRLEHE